nr:OmpA family protein [Litoreibacter roseus]
MGLAACTDTGKFYTEAGAEIDEGGFGNPTMNNMLVSMGEISATESLGRRFAGEVDDMVNFAFNSATLDESAKATLRQQAGWIRQFPEVKFRVYGHTDLVGSNAYNKQLGLRRAQAVVAYLSSQGVSRSRLEALASFGETRPVVKTQSAERRNRRTVTEVSGFTDGAGAGLNGKYAEVVFREYLNSAVSDKTIAIDAAGAG